MNRQRARRATAVVLVTLLLLLFSHMALAAYRMRPVPVRLSNVAVASTTVTSGDFRIRWDATRAQLIIHPPGGGAWATSPGRGFVAAAIGSETVAAHVGHYRIDDRRLVTCNRQTIDQLDAAAARITLGGVLHCDDDRPAVAYRLTIEALDARRLTLALNVADSQINRLYLTFASDRREHFFGFGEQYASFDLKGRRLPILSSDQGIGRGKQPLTWAVEWQAHAGGAWHTTYTAVPWLLSSRLRALALTDDAYAIFDMRRANDVQITLFGNALHAVLYCDDSPADLIEAYTADVGRMRPLPAWATSGVIVGMQGGTQAVRAQYATLRAADVPVAGFWLQDWVGSRTTSFGQRLWWNWTLDTATYPDFDQLVSDLAADDVYVLAYVNPHLTHAPHASRNLLAEATAQHYLITNATGAPILFDMGEFDVGMLDLDNPRTADWFAAVLRDEMLAHGVRGWMADFGEALPIGAYSFGGAVDSADHNRYPQQWAALNRAIVDADPHVDELLFFVRAANARTPAAATLFWTGDQLVTWDRQDGLKTAVTALLSGGVSGFAFNHSDTGGYTAVNNPPFVYTRSAELLWRWMELSAFSTVYRTHEGNRPQDNAQIDDDPATLAQLARTAKIYQAWGFYRTALIDEAAATGLPVMRHLWLHYPDDPLIANLEYEFLLGSELLVAPVVDPGRERVTLYLPAGEWVHVWSGQICGDATRGTRLTVAAPIGEPAVFYRLDSPIGAQFVANLRALGVLDAPRAAR